MMNSLLKWRFDALFYWKKRIKTYFFYSKRLSFYGLFVVFFLTNTLCAQESYLDSLYQKTDEQSAHSQYDSAMLSLKGIADFIQSYPQWEKLQTKLELYRSKWEATAPTLVLAELYFLLAKTHLNMGNYQGAEKWWNESLGLQQGVLQADTTKIAVIYQWLGETAMRQGQLEKSLKNFKTSLQLLKDAHQLEHKTIPELYYFLGAIHTLRGSYTEALDMARKGQNAAKQLDDDKNYIHAMLLLLQGNIYMQQEKNAAALTFHKKALEHVLNGDKKYHKELGYYHSNVATAHAGLKQFDQAVYHFKAGYNFNLKRWGKGHPTMAFDENNLGEVAFNQNQLQEAEQHYENALQIFQKTLGEYNAYLPKVYNNMGKIELRKEDPQGALSYFQKAICSNTGQAYEEDKLSALPNTDFYFRSVELLTSLRLKAKALVDMYNNQPDESLLAEIQSLYQSTDKLIDQMRQTYMEPADKITFGKVVKGIYEDALGVCWLAFQKTKNQDFVRRAFYFSEKSKAMVLLQSVSGNQALRFAGLPDSLLSKETHLKKSILQLEKQGFAARQKGQAEEIKKWDEEMEGLQTDYRNLVQQLEQDYPRYYQLKYDFKMLAPSDMQRFLASKNAALIAYFIGDNNSYVIVLSPSDSQFFSIHTTHLADKIVAFRQQFFTPNNWATSSSADFVNQATALYQILLEKPLSIVQNTDIERLIIVPDDNLAYLPFEVLIEKKPDASSIDYRKLPYLIRQYSLSYSWSATLLQQQQLPHFDASYNYVGFAPFYDKAGAQKLDSLDALSNPIKTRSNWQDLPAARESVGTIADMLNGKAFLKTKALKESFFDIANNSRILHFAMHALADDDNPLHSKLLFYGEDVQKHLYAFELYNTPIQTDLAVLSACNTGFGQLKKGEGIMSLSRAFTWAGCPAVVMSQWSVPDAATAAIMVDFHQNLKMGQTKDEALRQAKLAWLNDSELAPDRLHPFFWAGFVPLGNMEALDLKLEQNWWYLAGMLGGLLLVGLVLFFYFFKKET